MSKDTAFNRLPLSIKFCFFWIAFSLGWVLYSSDFSSESTIFVLGQIVSGQMAVLIFLIQIAVAVILLYLIYRCHSWAWKFGIAFCTFVFIDKLLLIPFAIRLVNELESALGANPIFYFLVGFPIFNLALSLIFILMFYKHRGFFEKESFKRT